MKPNWIGVYPAVTTKFFEDETLDLKTFNYNIDEQIKNNQSALVLTDKNLVEITKVVEKMRKSIVD